LDADDHFREVTDETNPIPREVVNVPQVRVYIDKFGQKKDDCCLVADLNGKIIGGVWVRILADKMKGYGNIDNKTPEFAISLFKEYRNCGIGTQLMHEMFARLKAKGYKQASLIEKDENADKDILDFNSFVEQKGNETVKTK
jgi:ribosomal protein S18 acetylase RimI-like enzyme